MKTLDELIYYCDEIEPVGALLLSGEWGCGKTYLVEHELRDALKNKAIVIRISLFGMETIGEIQAAVKRRWLMETGRGKKWSSIMGKAQSSKDILARLDFLPEWIKGLASTDWVSLIDIKNEIDGKAVILVFDDLERCNINLMDVLGTINSCCENQHFHTIIVANQMKIQGQEKNKPIKIDINHGGDANNNGKKLVAEIEYQKDEKTLPYAEIKEKIIQRTVEYIPDYPQIVHSVIMNIHYEEDTYGDFIKECETDLVDLFAPADDNVNQENKRPHNIRSLKCAIKDFYRVYKILIKNDFEDIKKWFYSFASYTIAYKANIARGGNCETTDDEVRKLYPMFQEQYTLNAVKNWILHGEWSEEILEREIDFIKERRKAKTPEEIVRTKRVIDVDEEVINEGFPTVLNMAYEGLLTLDEYILFLENSCWARDSGFIYSIDVDWKKIQQGVKICISRLINIKAEGQQTHFFIGEASKAHFTKDEWDTYCIIENFRNSNILVFSNNRQLYIEEMNKDADAAFVKCQNKRFDVFDEEMAIASATAYARGDNGSKHNYVVDFNRMWKVNIISPDIKKGESVQGFCKLHDMLERQLLELKSINKKIAVRHTNDFIENVNEIIEILKKDISKT